MTCPTYIGKWDSARFDTAFVAWNGFLGSPTAGGTGIPDSMVITPNGEQLICSVHDGTHPGFMTNRRLERISLSDPTLNLGTEYDSNPNPGIIRIIGAMDDGTLIYSMRDSGNTVLKKKNGATITTITSAWEDDFGVGSALFVTNGVFNPNTNEVFYTTWTSVPGTITLFLKKINLSGGVTTLGSRSWPRVLTTFVQSSAQRMSIGLNGEIWLRVVINGRVGTGNNETTILRWTSGSGLQTVPDLDTILNTIDGVALLMNPLGEVLVQYSAVFPTSFQQLRINPDLSTTPVGYDPVDPFWRGMTTIGAGYSQTYSRDLFCSTRSDFSSSGSPYEGHATAGARVAATETPEVSDIAMRWDFDSPLGLGVARNATYNLTFIFSLHTINGTGQLFFSTNMPPIQHVFEFDSWSTSLCTQIVDGILSLRLFHANYTPITLLTLLESDVPEGVTACQGLFTLNANYFLGLRAPMYATAWSGGSPYTMDLVRIDLTGPAGGPTGSFQTVLDTITTDTPEATNILQTRDGRIWFLAVNDGVRGLYQYSAANGIVRMENVPTLRKGIIPMGSSVWVATENGVGYRVDSNGSVSPSACMSGYPGYALNGLVSPGRNPLAPDAPWGVAWISNNLTTSNNDFFADATAIGSSSGTIEGTTYGTTIESGEPIPSAASGPIVESVWFHWTATSVDPVQFSAASTSTLVTSVYTGSTIDALTEVGSSLGSVVFQPSMGTTYRIQVSSQDASFTDDAFVLRWATNPVTVDVGSGSSVPITFANVGSGDMLLVFVLDDADQTANPVITRPANWSAHFGDDTGAYLYSMYGSDYNSSDVTWTSSAGFFQYFAVHVFNGHWDNATWDGGDARYHYDNTLKKYLFPAHTLGTSDGFSNFRVITFASYRGASHLSPDPTPDTPLIPLGSGEWMNDRNAWVGIDYDASSGYASGTPFRDLTWSVPGGDPGSSQFGLTAVMLQMDFPTPEYESHVLGPDLWEIVYPLGGWSIGRVQW